MAKGPIQALFDQPHADVHPADLSSPRTPGDNIVKSVAATRWQLFPPLQLKSCSWLASSNVTAWEPCILLPRGQGLPPAACLLAPAGRGVPHGLGQNTGTYQGVMAPRVCHALMVVKMVSVVSEGERHFPNISGRKEGREVTVPRAHSQRACLRSESCSGKTHWAVLEMCLLQGWAQGLRCTAA